MVVDVSHSGNAKSLAHPTARNRWPKIVAAAVADVEMSRAVPGLTPDEVEDGEAAAADLAQLLSDMQNDRSMGPLPADGAADIQAFNDELDQLGPMTWHNSPWLYTECYLYRAVQACFSRRNTALWKAYDVFSRQKQRALLGSGMAAAELVQCLDRAVAAVEEGVAGVAADALLEEMLEISLWGNAQDLLLLVHLSVEELQSRQGQRARASFKTKIVDDDSEAVLSLLAELRTTSGRPREIHVVLDNAGFEFVADLVLVAYLLAAGYADAVVLHGKAFPWFVSDATSQDLDFTLRTLQQATAFATDLSPEPAAALRSLGATLAGHFETGRLRWEQHAFWTTQHSYARLPQLAPDLWAQLAAADLVVFKGDLNYRKLVFDGLWPRTTPFQQAIGELGKFPAQGISGPRILSLRTCKADTVVGLAPGKEEEIDPQGAGEWTRNGQYAVISFFDGKST